MTLALNAPCGAAGAACGIAAWPPDAIGVCGEDCSGIVTDGCSIRAGTEAIGGAAASGGGAAIGAAAAGGDGGGGADDAGGACAAAANARIGSIGPRRDFPSIASSSRRSLAWLSFATLDALFGGAEGNEARLPVALSSTGPTDGDAVFGFDASWENEFANAIC